VKTALQHHLDLAASNRQAASQLILGLPTVKSSNRDALLMTLASPIAAGPEHLQEGLVFNSAC
jgi:hypothetical protein